MGNVSAFLRDAHILSEFERVKKASNKYDYLTVDEAKELNSLEEMPIDFKKLAVLFMLDVDKNGKFTIDDMTKFAEWCATVTVHVPRGDQQSFRSEVQAQCTLHMWKQINTENGKEAFSDWVVRLFSTGMVVRLKRKKATVEQQQQQQQEPISIALPNSILQKQQQHHHHHHHEDDEHLDHGSGDDTDTESDERTRDEKTQEKSPKATSVMFISTDTVITLHKILTIQELYGINCQALIDLMQRVGEELGMMGLDDEELDDVIPANVIHIFAENFVTGFLSMMDQLGFDKYLALTQKRQEQQQVDDSDEKSLADSDCDDDGSSGSLDDDDDSMDSPQPEPPKTFQVNGLSMTKLKFSVNIK